MNDYNIHIRFRAGFKDEELMKWEGSLLKGEEDERMFRPNKPSAMAIEVLYAPEDLIISRIRVGMKDQLVPTVPPLKARALTPLASTHLAFDPVIPPEALTITIKRHA